MADLPLNVRYHLPGVGLIPAPIEVLGDDPQLNYKIAGQILRFGLPALLPPEPQQGGLIFAHDDPGVGTSYKMVSNSLDQYVQEVLHPCTPPIHQL